jgi:predicted GNAT family acetyltransferase
MAEPSTPPIIEHDAAGAQFVCRTDWGVAYLAYAVRDADTVEFFTVFVPPEARGRGLAEAITRHAYAWAATRALAVQPTCSYVRRLAATDPTLEAATRP